MFASCLGISSSSFNGIQLFSILEHQTISCYHSWKEQIVDQLKSIWKPCLTWEYTGNWFDLSFFRLKIKDHSRMVILTTVAVIPFGSDFSNFYEFIIMNTSLHKYIFTYEYILTFVSLNNKGLVPNEQEIW